jgi:hypothetical protein
LFSVEDKKYLRRFVKKCRKYAAFIDDYWNAPFTELSLKQMKNRMFVEIAIPGAITALQTVPSSDHLKIELLRPFLLPEGITIDRPLAINRAKNPSRLEEIPTFPLVFFQQLFYPRSFRRLRDMSTFWSLYVRASFHRFRDSAEPSWRVPVVDPDTPLVVSTPSGRYEGETWSIPVTRYQEGMSGLYYGHRRIPERTQFCGTFFYFEPDSDSHLLTTRLVVAKNKFNACKFVGIGLDAIYDMYHGHWLMASKQGLFKLIFIELLSDDWMEAVDDESGEYPDQDLRLRQLLAILYNGEVSEEDRKNGWRYDFDTHHPELYAFEDALDQGLCLHAESSDIDTILLTHMTGESRLVSEVLDTRKRKKLFENMWIQRGEETLVTLML